MPAAGRPTTACVASASAACAAQPNGAPAGECGVGDETYVPKSGYLRVPNDKCDDQLAGATRFAVAAPKACPTPVKQCRELSCGACATADNCLWCAQSVAGSVDWAVGMCVDVENATSNFCTQEGVFVAYSAWLCMARRRRRRRASCARRVARDEANLACAQVCGDHNLAVQSCPCDASHELGKDVGHCLLQRLHAAQHGAMCQHVPLAGQRGALVQLQRHRDRRAVPEHQRSRLYPRTQAGAESGAWRRCVCNHVLHGIHCAFDRFVHRVPFERSRTSFVIDFELLKKKERKKERKKEIMKHRLNSLIVSG
jgi:hypothetical protein